MSTTTAGRQLTGQHSRRQLAIRSAALADLLDVWQGFDVRDIERSWAALEPAVEAITRDYRNQSASQAVNYYQAHRTAEGVPDSFRPQAAGAPSREQLRYSLGYYGKVVPNELLRVGGQNVARQTVTQLAGGVSRHVQDGGRYTLLDAVQEDGQATGYIRVTNSAKPCAFCAMLAARGPVYKSKARAESVGAEFGRVRGTQARGESFHDHCQCTAEPQYITDDSWRDRFPQNAEFRKMYDDAQREARASGELRRGTKNDALNALRRKMSAI